MQLHAALKRACGSAVRRAATVTVGTRPWPHRAGFPATALCSVGGATTAVALAYSHCSSCETFADLQAKVQTHVTEKTSLSLVHPSEVDEALCAVLEILKEAKYGFLVSLDASGAHEQTAHKPRGRIVEVHFEEGLAKLWISTNEATRKVQQVMQQERVAVLVWHAESMSAVELGGCAKVLRGAEAQAKWPGKEWLTFIPEGPQSVRYCCIEISVDYIEIVSVGYGIALGEDPGHWHPPLCMTRTTSGTWALQEASKTRLHALREGMLGIACEEQGKPVAALGTTNPGKLEACKRCFEEWPDNISFRLRGVSVPSGVSEQPMGLEETLLGAKHRAAAAFSQVAGASIGIGLESGLVIVDGVHVDFCACAIYDGTHHYVGLSSGWALPPRVASSFAQRGYNQAFEDIGIPADDRGAGVLGQLSGGVLSRPKQMKESISMALLQQRNRNIYTSSE